MQAVALRTEPHRPNPLASSWTMLADCAATCAAFSPCGLFLAIGCGDGALLVLDMASGGATVGCLRPAADAALPCIFICWSPNSRFIAAGTEDAVRVLDALEGSQVAEYRSPSISLVDGQWVASRPSSGILLLRLHHPPLLLDPAARVAAVVLPERDRAMTHWLPCERLPTGALRLPDSESAGTREPPTPTPTPTAAASSPRGSATGSPQSSPRDDSSSVATAAQAPRRTVLYAAAAWADAASGALLVAVLPSSGHMAVVDTRACSILARETLPHMSLPWVAVAGERGVLAVCSGVRGVRVMRLSPAAAAAAAAEDDTDADRPADGGDGASAPAAASPARPAADGAAPQAAAELQLETLQVLRDAVNPVQYARCALTHDGEFVLASILHSSDAITHSWHLDASHSLVSLKLPAFDGVRWLAAHPSEPRFAAVTRDGSVWALQDLYRSAWPGPMFPAGFRLLDVNKAHDEPEDEFDNKEPNAAQLAALMEVGVHLEVAAPCGPLDARGAAPQARGGERADGATPFDDEALRLVTLPAVARGRRGLWEPPAEHGGSSDDEEEEDGDSEGEGAGGAGRKGGLSEHGHLGARHLADVLLDEDAGPTLLSPLLLGAGFVRAAGTMASRERAGRSAVSAMTSRKRARRAAQAGAGAAGASASDAAASLGLVAGGAAGARGGRSRRASRYRS